MVNKKYMIFATLIATLGLGAFFLRPNEYRNYPAKFSLQEDFSYQEQPDEISCGPTSASMLLKYYGKDVSVKDIKDVASTTWFKYGDNKEFGMTIPEKLVKAMNHYLVPVKMKREALHDIIKYVNEKRPPMVLVRSGKFYWHWVVVIGYDEKSIIVADPGWGCARTMTREAFEGSWAFTHDMQGNKMGTDCPACGGDGKLFDMLGPLGNCDTCGGSGVLPDLMKRLVESVDVYGNTLIVPNE